MKMNECQKSWLGTFLGVLICALVMIVPGCEEPPDTKSQNPANPANAILTGQAENSVMSATNQPPQNTNLAGVVNYGNGVYYFPIRGAAFGNAVSSFLMNHRNLEVTAIGVDIVRMRGESPTPSYSAFPSDWGGVSGYFVTFREKSH